MIPVLGTLILQAAYGAVDLLVVGRFGSTSGLSAVSTGSQVLNLVTFVVIQFAMGITVLIARYLGEKNRSRSARLSRSFDRVYAHFRRFIRRHGLFCPPDRHSHAGARGGGGSDRQLHPHLRRRHFLHRRLQPAVRHLPRLGDSQSPLLFVLVACIVNVIGDLALVAGLHMDAAGAAIATVSAQALSVVFAILLLN